MNIADLRELIQDDLICFLGIVTEDQEIIDKCCQIIVDRFNEYKTLTELAK